MMTAMFTAAQDAHRGVTDRFRTLPMSRAAVPLGQTAADLLTTAVSHGALMLVGLAMGWRIENGLPGAAGRRSVCCCSSASRPPGSATYLGPAEPSEEAAGQLGGATFVLPLLSNAYMPTDGLPGWLRTIAEWNPISAVAAALRDLFGNAPVPTDGAWPVTHPVAGSLAWCAVLLAVFMPLAVRRYAHGRRLTGRAGA